MTEEQLLNIIITAAINEGKAACNLQPAVSLKLGKTTGYVTNQPNVQAKRL